MRCWLLSAVVCVRDAAVHPNLDVEPLTRTDNVTLPKVAWQVRAEHEEDEEDRQRLADRVLGILEDAVYWGIALVLIIGSIALLIAQFNTMLRLRMLPVETVMLEIWTACCSSSSSSSCFMPCGLACGRMRSSPNRS